MRIVIVALALVACGRVHFDPRRDAAMPAADTIRLDVVVTNPTGCADGEREGFVNLVQFPTVAGCGATWTGGQSLRDPRTGAACGDDGPACVSPGDVCATGWHVCGFSGDPQDLSSRMTAAQCANAGGAAGSFVAALGHCASCPAPCNTGEAVCVYTPPPYPCPTTAINCAGPVCCGAACTASINCTAGVFPAPDTRVGAGVCGAMQASTQTGVLCCAD